MKAVILAAGIASRLRPLTSNTPKALLPVGGTPLLRRALLSLLGGGIREVVIVTGYLQQMLESTVRSFEADLRITFVHNPLFETTNNNYSLWLTKGEILGEDLLMLDADILFDHSILVDLVDSPLADALVVRTAGAVGPEDVKVECDTSGHVVRIGKDIRPERATGESLGIEKFSAATTHQLFASLDRRKDRNEFYEASFQEVIDGGAKIGVIDSGGRPCIEIDTPDDLKAADRLASRMKLPAIRQTGHARR